MYSPPKFDSAAFEDRAVLFNSSDDMPGQITMVYVAYATDMMLALVVVTRPNCWATLGISKTENTSPQPRSIFSSQTMSPII